MSHDDYSNALYLQKENTGKERPHLYTMEHWENDKSYRFIKSIKNYLISPVADFGCGHGPLSILTARLGVEVTAFDCIKEKIDNGNRLKRDGDRVNFTECFLSGIPAGDNTFASGLCKEVLEHIVAPKLPVVLAEIRRVMRPGAPVIFTVPRESILGSMAPQEHVTFFETPRRFARYVRKQGFTIEKKEFNRMYRRICVIARVEKG